MVGRAPREPKRGVVPGRRKPLGLAQSLTRSGFSTMRRRELLRVGLAATAWLAASAHTPYRQWQIYRRKHLLIGTSKADAATYPLGQEIAEVLATHLPESSARVTRGPDPWRLASLLTTGQLDVVLLSGEDVAALRDGAPPFEAFGRTELRTLFRFGDHWLVTRPDFPAHHAFEVARTLGEQAGTIEAANPAGSNTSPVPVHPGALAFTTGAPKPAPVEPAGDAPPPGHGHDHDHVH